MLTAGREDMEVLLKIRDLATAQLTAFEGKVKATATASTMQFTHLSRATAVLRSGIVRLAGAAAGLMAFRAAVRTIADFEITMKTVQAVMRATPEDFERLTAAARHLGATTKFTAAEAGEGLLILARTGLTTAAAIDTLPQVLSLAASANISLAEAADFTTGVMAQFALRTEEAERAVDAITVVSNRSKTDVGSFGEALKYVGTVAATAGISLEETAAMVGTLAERQLKGSMAGTALRQAILSLAGGGKQVTDTLKRMGIELAEVDLRSHSAADVFERLRQGGMGLAEAQKMFGDRAAAGAVILAQNTGKLRELTRAQKENRGETAAVSRAMQDTLQGAMRNLASAAEELMHATGDQGLAGSMRSVVDTMTGAIRVLAGVEGAEETATTASKMLATAISAVVKGLALLILLKVILFFKTLALAIAEVARMAWVVAASPIFLIAAGIAALGYAAYEGGKALGLWGDKVADAVADLEPLDKALEEIARKARKATVDFAAAQFAGNVADQARALLEQRKMLEDMMDRARSGAKGFEGVVQMRVALELVPEIAGTDLYRQAADAARNAAPFVGDPNQAVALRAAKLLADTLIPIEELKPLLKSRLEEVAAELKDLEAGMPRMSAEMMGVVDVEAVDKAKTSIEKVIAALKIQNAVMREGGAAGEFLATQMQLAEHFALLEAGARDKLTEALAREIQAKYELAAQKAARGQLQQLLAGWEAEKDRLEEELGIRQKLTAEERADLAVKQAITQATAANIPYSQQQVDQLREYVLYVEKLRDLMATRKDTPTESGSFSGGWHNVIDQFDTAGERMAIAGNGVADALMNAFNVRFFDPMTGKFRELAEIGRDMLLSLADAIQSLLTRMIAMEIISSIGGALGLAKGGVLGPSGVKYAQRGTIIGQPTFLGMSGNQPVIGGEAGNEVVLPIAKTSSGDLGVRAVGGGGGGTVMLNFAPTYNVQGGGGGTDVACLDRLSRDSEKRMQNWLIGQMSGGGPVRASIVRAVRMS